jgi:hypothetical protein
MLKNVVLPGLFGCAMSVGLVVLIVLQMPD